MVETEPPAAGHVPLRLKQAAAPTTAPKQKQHHQQPHLTDSKKLAPSEDGEFGGARKSTAPQAVQVMKRLIVDNNRRLRSMTSSLAGGSKTKQSAKAAEQPTDDEAKQSSRSVEPVNGGDAKPRNENSKHSGDSKHEGKHITGEGKHSTGEGKHGEHTKHESKALKKNLSNVISAGYSAILGRSGSGGQKESPAVPTADATAPAAAIRFCEPNKYFIENYKDCEEPVKFGDEEGASMRHGVMINHCENCTIQISKKVNKVELGDCNKVTLILPAVLSSIDVQHSHSCTIQVTSRCPGLNIDGSTSINVYIPRDSMEVIEIASSGGGSANLLVPSEEDETEYKEYPIPFQFVHSFKDGKLHSQASPLYFH